MRNSFNIRPIPSDYKGHTYRSRLEARWAIFFDLAGIPFMHEMEGFGIKPRCGYLPDYWLPLAKTYIEVKPTTPTADEMEKAELLCTEFRLPIVIVVGDPYETIEAHWFWACPWAKLRHSYADLVDGKIISHHVDTLKKTLDLTPFNVSPSQLLRVDEEYICLYAGPQHGASLSWIPLWYGIDEVTGDTRTTIVPRMEKGASAWQNEETDEVSYTRFCGGLERHALTARNWRFW